ncbi:hypothetical protein AX16_000379 [Volvariella volvacea WC 439]|nr:hypothetical protein AX16_000379 [Volvariella volvacea WC 439]
MPSPASSLETLLSNPSPKPDFHPPARSAPFRRRHLLAVCSSLALASLAALALFSLRGPPQFVIVAEEPASLQQDDTDISNGASFNVTQEDPFAPKFWLRGPPTAHFRDNLRPDLQYITSWVAAGWTNDVMTYANLIYLALITDRIPIMPMFTPSHIGSHVPPIPFGEVFDVPRLSKALGKPVLEWRDVKDSASNQVDDIGCWNVWEAVQSREHHPRRSPVPGHLKLDISYTTAPTWVKLLPQFQHDLHSSFWALAALSFPETRASSLVPPRESPQHHVSLPPDEQLLCYDYLYYVSAHQPFEFEFDYSPAWRFVAQHMHFTPALQQLAETYVRRAFGTPGDAPLPPWIAIHARHADFKVFCKEVELSDCFAPISVIARRVREVQDELFEQRGIRVEHVIMTSDEKDASWWQEVSEQGWYAINHTRTAELYGEWYPVLIDVTIQASGVGFVGTDRSTMSMIARRRVQAWSGGSYRNVKWGKPGADDH